MRRDLRAELPDPAETPLADLIAALADFDLRGYLGHPYCVCGVGDFGPILCERCREVNSYLRDVLVHLRGRGWECDLLLQLEAQRERLVMLERSVDQLSNARLA